MSGLELSRDGILIVVKDNSKVLRTELTDEEKKDYCNSAYFEHLARKSLNVAGQHKNHDSLLDAAQSRKVDWSKPRL